MHLIAKNINYKSASIFYDNDLVYYWLGIMKTNHYLKMTSFKFSNIHSLITYSLIPSEIQA